MNFLNWVTFLMIITSTMFSVSGEEKKTKPKTDINDWIKNETKSTIYRQLRVYFARAFNRSICPYVTEPFCPQIQNVCWTKEDCPGKALCCQKGCSYVCVETEEENVKKNLTSDDSNITETGTTMKDIKANETQELNILDQSLSFLERRQLILFFVILSTLIFLTVIAVCVTEVDHKFRENKAVREMARRIGQL